MESTGIHDRLAAIVGNRTYRELSKLTGTHHETIRRFMNGQAPSTEFLHSLCKALNINAHWLLMGSGAMRTEDIRQEALREADPIELLSAMADVAGRLVERVDSIERYLQSVETRLRASGTDQEAGARLQAGRRAQIITEVVSQRAS